MGTLARCLCFALTLLMAGSRPTAGIRNGSPESDRWWGTQDAQDVRRALDRYRKTANYSALETTAQRAYQLAMQRGACVPAVRYLINVAGARMLLFRYRAALDALLEGRKLAQAVGDRTDEGAILVNLSSLYLEMSDTAAALQYAEQARAITYGHPYYQYQLLLQLGKLYALMKNPAAEATLGEEIEAARAQGDARQEARGWDYLGDEWLRQGRLDAAERAFTEAFRIRKLLYPAELPYSYARLGSLRLAQDRLEEASLFTDLAIRASDPIESAFPKFVLVHQRGEIRRARGDQAGALNDFRAAARLASAWNRETLPAVSTLTATNIELEKQVFDSWIESAAAAGRVQESFEAVEKNRAASLRDTIALAGDWRKRLSRKYWDALGELRAEQARLARIREPGSSELDRVRTEVTAMEAEAGLRIFAEATKDLNPLAHLKLELGPADLFLSFHVGKTASYVWSATSGSLTLHRLPAGSEIRAAVVRFRDAVREGADSTQFGIELYQLLFAQLSRDEAAKHDWLISADDALWEAPLSALSVNGKYLIEQHSIRFLPGALSLAVAPKKPAGAWLGVGDPIYNTADGRSPRRYTGWFANAAPSGQLNRLPGSLAELESSARSWGDQPLLLEGAAATREKFQAAAARELSVIHLATHVLTTPDRPGQALIAFAINAAGNPEFLTTADVSMMRIPGAVVAMTGCASGTGDIQTGAGLLGLTRAWQMAGASAVISTLWPMTDSQGELFASFYRYLREMTPAEALRRSQIEMIASGTWRGSPRYWSAYQVTGGAR